MLSTMTWNDTFEALFDRCLALYQGGNHDFASYYSEDDLNFLTSIGYQPREFFDFIEDYGDSKDPSFTTALLVASVRRDYFLTIQGGQPSGKRVSSGDIPSKTSDIDGLVYLPRLIEKAEAKLRGELDPNLMFCCGGDRRFFREHGQIHPADFLRHVWAANGDHQKIISWVKFHLKSS